MIWVRITGQDNNQKLSYWIYNLIIQQYTQKSVCDRWGASMPKAEKMHAPSDIIIYKIVHCANL